MASISSAPVTLLVSQHLRDNVLLRDILLVASTSYPATAGLMYVFARDAMTEWWRERPAVLIGLLLIGLLLSIMGASTPHYMRPRPTAISSRIGQFSAACALGLALGLIGGAVGWVAEDMS